MSMWLQYDENYMISDEGQVKSIRYGKERILKPFRMGNYLGVWLGAGHKHYIHHLVAEIFCPKDADNLQVDHINRNKHDNRACNLRWVTASFNMKNRNDYHRKGSEYTRYGKKIICVSHIVKCNAV